MKYVAIFHANLNYAFLTPDKYERTIRASYEVIFDTFANHPDQRYVFEASGYTIDTMAKLTPDVLAKLRTAIKSGQCEFMGAPYAHPVIANVPEEDAYWSCEFSQRTYEKHLGFRPESWWNPECTWMQYAPRAFAKAGAKYLTLDFESYMNSNDPKYSWVERNRTRDIYWGGHLPAYPVDPNCKFLHRPFHDIVPGLDGFCRSDRLVGKYISYFMGKITVEDYLGNVKKWTGKDEKGATIIIADDAEYCGTTGYYYVKYYRDYDKCFVVDPDAGEKLDKLIAGIRKMGQLVTFKEACQLEPVKEPFYVEDGYAWHRTYSVVWGGTPEAQEWDPILSEMRRDYKKNVQPIAEGRRHGKKFRPLVEDFWFHITCAANSDGRWPAPPAKTCPFNRDWVLKEMAASKKALAKLKKAVAGIPLPKKEPYRDDPNAESNYTLHFTDKPMRTPADMAKLNTYELSHAIYYFHSMVDSGVPEKVARGKEILRAIFDELDRREMRGIRPLAAQRNG
jgi:hypothetical protein